MIHTVKDFSIVNEADVDAFLEFSCFLYDQMNFGNLISGSSAFSKSILNIWKFSVHTLLKPLLENFEHYFASVWDECNCLVVWTFFGIAFLWDWNENWYFTILWPLMSFPSLLACEMSAIVWESEHSLALPFFGIGMKTDLFQSCGHCWVFQIQSICWHIECSTLIGHYFRIWNSSAGIPSPPLACL